MRITSSPFALCYGIVNLLLSGTWCKSGKPKQMNITTNEDFQTSGKNRKAHATILHVQYACFEKTSSPN